MPVVAGSYFDAAQGLGLPAYPPSRPNFSASLLSNTWNRALYTSWQSGFWNVRIDQALLSSVGLAGNGSMRLDTSFLGRFIPGLSQVIPSGVNAPVVIDVEPLCQPILHFTRGAPMCGLVQMTELNVHVLADPGTGFVRLFSFAVYAELEVDFTVQGGRQLALLLGPTPRFDAELLFTSLPASGVDWALVMTTVVPPAISAAVATLQPIPLPTLGVPGTAPGLTNASVAVEGPLDEFLTVHGDL
jgi:hypothetical protein